MSSSLKLSFLCNKNQKTFKFGKIRKLPEERVFIRKNALNLLESIFAKCEGRKICWWLPVALLII